MPPSLSALRPSLLVFSATDLWPELIREARRAGTRVALISGTLAPTSSRRSGLAASLLAGTWPALDAVGAIGENDAAALREAGVPAAHIMITGDTRHDSAAARAAAIDHRSPLLNSLASDAPVLVAGSTWPSDEAVLLEALRSLSLRVIIAPHEPSAAHLADLERRLASIGAVSIRLAQFERWPDAALSVCLVDRVGVLADLYAIASIAFVGGGFHDAGLHSVIEPAAHGVPVLFGPKRFSSNDAALLIEAGGARSVANAAELQAALREWLPRTTAGKAARGVVDRGVGAADRSVDLLETLMR